MSTVGKLYGRLTLNHKPLYTECITKLTDDFFFLEVPCTEMSTIDVGSLILPNVLAASAKLKVVSDPVSRKAWVSRETFGPSM